MQIRIYVGILLEVSNIVALDVRTNNCTFITVYAVIIPVTRDCNFFAAKFYTVANFVALGFLYVDICEMEKKRVGKHVLQILL